MALTIALPKGPFTPATVYAVDLTNPVVAYSTVQDTYETSNTLVTDTVQPVNALLGVEPEPEPEPEPPMKVYEREGIAEAPVQAGFPEAPAEVGFPEAPAEVPAPVDVAGTPPPSGSAGMGDLSVVRIPTVTAAAVRLAPPRPFSEAPPLLLPLSRRGWSVAVPLPRCADPSPWSAAVPRCPWCVVPRCARGRKPPKHPSTPRRRWRIRHCEKAFRNISAMEEWSN